MYFLNATSHLWPNAQPPPSHGKSIIAACSLVGNAKGIPTFVKIELLVPTTCMDPRRPLQNYKQDRSTRNHVFNVGLSGKLH